MKVLLHSCSCEVLRLTTARVHLGCEKGKFQKSAEDILRAKVVHVNVLKFY
jgi:hypothetical protein